MARFQVFGGQKTTHFIIPAFLTSLIPFSPLAALGTASSAAAEVSRNTSANERLLRCQSQTGLAQIRACTAALAITGLTEQQKAVVHFYRGLARFEAKKYPLAIMDYSKAVLYEPKFAAAYNNRGFTYLTLGQLGRAEKDFTAVLAIEPDHQRALSNRAVVLEKQKRFAEAARDYTTLIKRFPHRYAYRLARGHALYQSGSIAAAIADFSDYIMAQPYDPEGFYLRALAYQTQGQQQAALEDFKRALALRPKRAEILAARAYSWLQINQPLKALADLNQALKAQPNFIYAYQLRAGLWRQQGKHQAAINDYSRALELTRQQSKHDTAKQIEWLIARAWSYAKTGAFQAAIRDAGQALALDHNNMEALIARGHFFTEIRDFKGAVADFSHVLELITRPSARQADPAQPSQSPANAPHQIKAQILNSRAWAYFLWSRQDPENNLGLLAKALSDINHSLRLQPDNGYARDTRGWIMIALERPDQALVDFQYALAVHSHTPVTIYTGIGHAHQLRGDLEAAYKAFAKAVTLQAKMADEKEFQQLAKSQLARLEKKMAKSARPPQHQQMKTVQTATAPPSTTAAANMRKAQPPSSDSSAAPLSFWRRLLNSLKPASLTSKSVYCYDKNSSGYGKAAC